MPDRPTTLERLVFFSDAVFAISITLLALDLRLPAELSPDSDAGFLDALVRAAPQLFAFVLSFFIGGAFWIGHVRTLHSITRTNSTLITLNLVVLFFIALLPFPTSVLAEHGDLSYAALLYAVCVGFVGLAAVSLWLYATRVAGLAPAVSPDLSRAIAIRMAVTPALFGFSIPVALIAPSLAPIVWLATFPATTLVSRRLGIGAAIEHSLSSD
ncbi:MAG TPA: TMEM175 family protein [Candidatus Limnocylindrales bacterium]|nr:TMEM175 family protein [Candidatus Limnocylindrales bacterium]